jgi:hypothetical protein
MDCSCPIFGKQYPQKVSQTFRLWSDGVQDKEG